jgi:hypothetical protein
VGGYGVPNQAMANFFYKGPDRKKIIIIGGTGV